MPPSLLLMLVLLSEIAKKNQTGPVHCQGCYRSAGIIRHGYYYRYLFNSLEMVKIQRYRCLNPDCDYLTFSIPPHPFLRYVRLPLCFLQALLSVYESGTESLSSLARQTGLSRPRVKQAILAAPKLILWVDQLGLWPDGGRPCLNPEERWTDFTRAFSWSFFPLRYGLFQNHTN